MAYMALTDLIAKTITRLRMVGGASTQLYAEDAIAMMLEETYEMVRVERWWDHLMKWENHQLDGSTGMIVGNITGASEGWRDVQHVFFGGNNTPLPIMSSDINPFRLSGTYPRFIEPLNIGDDPGGKLFRVWPKTAITTTQHPLRIRVRVDPSGIFTNPAAVVPFDATCLVNGAAFKYAADDGTNPTSVASLQTAFEARLAQLRRAHDNAVIILDPRQGNLAGLSEWTEDWR